MVSASFEARRRVYLESYRLAREEPFFVSRAVEQIIACLGELTTATRWGEVRSSVDKMFKKSSARRSTKPEELVCYCLGDLSELGVAFQLAFFLLIAHQFAIPPARRLVFDPLHTEKDRQLLQLCGCTSLSHNERALRRVTCSTLFYMPFAPFDLTDNVLRANWDVLDRVMIIGNPLNWVVNYRWSRDEESKGTAGEDNEDGKDGGSVGSGQGENSMLGVESAEAYLLLQQKQQQQERKTYTSRAPCVEAALHLATEEVLWEDNLVTWTLAQAENEVEKERTEMAAQKEEQGEDQHQDEDGHEDGNERTPPTEAAQRAQTRYSLNATFAVFAAPPTDWPSEPPPPRAPVQKQARSRL
jgi:hypothetical protein